ncbi:MAG: protein TolR [Betaproteobacteria bacterium]|jgi:biopolymer transport protein TolR|nr:protein TolR [Betaproteobacteria bacterium]NBT10594.1 protein TolR [Betaproteobacteria bacterium]NBU48575.1 protein TolR [Betaproteobacteria bacterium]NBX95345.1 protein TolR [Betaproteobacteria bacterium]
MAAVQGRAGRGRRRGMAEINMVPFIDVMLVLLIIFMVSAPLITTGVVNLPSVGQSQQRPPKVVEVVVDKNGQFKVRSEGEEGRVSTLGDLGAQVQRLQAGDAQVPVVISADRDVKYDEVVKVMDTLQKAGVSRLGLSVQQGS